MFCSNLLVLGQKVTLEEVSRDESGSTYQSLWTTTGLPVTQKNQRSQCPVVIEVCYSVKLHEYTCCYTVNSADSSLQTFSSLLYDCRSFIVVDNL